MKTQMNKKLLKGTFAMLLLALGTIMPVTSEAGPAIPETCDILQNILCGDPVAYLFAVIEDLLR